MNNLAPDLSPQILDALFDAVVVTSSDGIVRRMNRVALNWLGYTANEVVGQPVNKFVEEAVFFRGGGLEQLAREGLAREVAATLITRAGERVPVVLNGVTLRNNEGELLVVGVAQLAVRDQTQHLIQAAEARAAEAHVFKAVAEALNRAVGLQEALDRSLEVVMERVGSESGWVVLLEEHDETRLAAARNLPPALEADDRAAMRWPACTCLRQLVTGELTAAANIVECERLQQAHGDTCGLRFHAAVPLRIGGRVLGNLNLTTPADRMFTDDELNLLTTVGDQIAVAIERAQLHEQVKAHHIAEQATLLKLSQALLGETEAQAVMEQALAVVAEVFRPDLCKILLLDEAQECLTLRAGRGWKPGQIGQATVPSGKDSQAGYTLNVRQAVVVEDFTRESRFQPPALLTEHEVVAGMSTPMLVGTRALGVLGVHWRSPRRFADDEARLLALIANDTAQALERARLFEAEREQRELAEALRDALAAGAALSATLDFDTVLDRLLDQVARVVPYDSANIMLLDPQTGRIRIARQRGYELFGAQVVQDIARLSFDITSTTNLRRMAETGQPLIIPNTAADPGWVKVEASAGVRSWAGAPIIVQGQVVAFFSLDKIEPNFYRPKHGERLAAFAGQAALAIQNARLFEATAARNQQLRRLYELAALLAGDPQTVFEQVAAIVAELLATRMATVERVVAGQLIIVAMWHDGEIQRGGIYPLSGTPCESVVNVRQPCRYSSVIERFPNDPFLHTHGVQAYIGVPILDSRGEVTGVLQAMDDHPRAFSDNDEHLLAILGQRVGAELERQHELEEKERLFEEAQRRTAELEAVAEVSSALRQARTREAMLPLLVKKTMDVLHADAGALILLERERLVFVAVRGPAEALLGQRHPVGDDPLWQVMHTGQAIFVSDITERDAFNQWPVCRTLMQGLTACACIPLKTAETTVGLLYLASRSARMASPTEIRLLTSIAEMAGNAIHRAALHEQTEQRLQRLVALHTIDQAISASLDLRLTLNVLLDQVITQLRLDAATVLLFNPDTQLLKHAVGRGFRSPTTTRTFIRLGEGHAGQAALERRIINISNLPQATPVGRRTQQLTVDESFVTYYAVPLVAKGRIKGVLEIFHRTLLEPDQEWLDFLGALAAQAAIAIDNASLFDAVQRSNVELALAYDATIEGWSHALDLRDKETEGHTLRVTEMTLRLAQAVGLSEDEQVHLRRGALLHDIGKMGIPDSILLKPGPLTEAEWVIMRQHPVYAYEMLHSVAYLRPAFDIPYCHHEKWDGSGYPRGLSGGAIPLAARIFTVVDVWDALRSDRPYRAAWPEEKVRHYIQGQAGKHFDPKMVEVFLQVVG